MNYENHIKSFTEIELSFLLGILRLYYFINKQKLHSQEKSFPVR